MTESLVIIIVPEYIGIIDPLSIRLHDDIERVLVLASYTHHDIESMPASVFNWKRGRVTLPDDSVIIPLLDTAELILTSGTFPPVHISIVTVISRDSFVALIIPDDVGVSFGI